VTRISSDVTEGHPLPLTPLVLQIENHEVLEDGGTVRFVVPQDGCKVGRKNTMDWVLPDMTRLISGHHFDIVANNDNFWLRDVSTNGTFLKGSRFRLEKPHKLADQDRFQVGQYNIVAKVEGAVSAASEIKQPPHAKSEAKPGPVPRSYSDGPAVPPPAPRPGQAPKSTKPSKESQSFVRAFCDAASISSTQYNEIDAQALARALGNTMRLVTADIMALLRQRAETPQLNRGSDFEKTGEKVINPLEAMPTGDQALIMMFLREQPGFLDGPDGFEAAMRDIRSHQSAAAGALRPAITQLLEGLNPQDIETAAGGGGMFGNAKSKAWDIFVERWDQRARSDDNGMTDEFLTLFAKAYSDKYPPES